MLNGENISTLNYRVDAQGNDILCMANGTRYTGTAYKISPSSYVTTEYEVKNGLKDGVEKEFYSDGSTEHLVHYWYGLLHGDFIYYCYDGTYKERSVFEYGILLEAFEWDDSGTLLNHELVPVDDAKFQKIIRLRDKFAW